MAGATAAMTNLKPHAERERLYFNMKPHHSPALENDSAEECGVGASGEPGVSQCQGLRDTNTKPRKR